jgi:signal transduction histidine kinase
MMRAAMHTEIDPAAEYASLLGAYLTDGSEAHLAAGYQWGRRALERGESIPEVIAAHQRAFAARCRELPAARGAELDEAASRFLAESLAPYEMARRGVRDAVLALRHVNEALEHESQRIARAVHDEAGQLAVVLQLSLAELARQLPADAAASLQPLHATLLQVERQLRQLSHELRPSMLDDLGWLPAVRWLAQSLSARSPLAVVVHSDFDARLPGPVEIAIYRVVQEALTNVVRHARAQRVTISATRSAKAVTVTVVDDGVGFDVAAPPIAGDRGLGLLGIRERLAAVGGTLQIHARPHHGTRLAFSVPLEA